VSPPARAPRRAACTIFGTSRPGIVGDSVESPEP
jgi:hypothetical protein